MNEETKRTDGLVAETGKLIDADALLEAINKEIGCQPYSLRVINSQPDASEPLRKRIAELEAKLLELNLDCARNGRVGWVADDATYWSIRELLKGGPDA